MYSSFASLICSIKGFDSVFLRPYLHFTSGPRHPCILTPFLLHFLVSSGDINGGSTMKWEVRFIHTSGGLFFALELHVVVPVLITVWDMKEQVEKVAREKFH